MSDHISFNIRHKKYLNHCRVLPRLDAAIRRLKTLTPTLAHRQRKISWDQIGMGIRNENPEDMYVRMSIGRCQLPSIESIYTYWTRHAPVMETFWAWEVCPVLSLAAPQKKHDARKVKVSWQLTWYDRRWDAFQQLNILLQAICCGLWPIKVSFLKDELCHQWIGGQFDLCALRASSSVEARLF